MDVQNCRDSHPGTSERESVDRRKRPARPMDGSPGNSQFEAPQGLPCSNETQVKSLILAQIERWRHG